MLWARHASVFIYEAKSNLRRNSWKLVFTLAPRVKQHHR